MCTSARSQVLTFKLLHPAESCGLEEKQCPFAPRYSPETKEAKKQRLLAMAKAQEGGGQVESKKPLMLKCFADSLAQPAVKPSADILCGDNARAQRCRQLQSQVRSRSYSQLLSCLARNVSKPVLATPNHTADLSELLLGCTEADFCK